MAKSTSKRARDGSLPPSFAAIDLGTNNCRLLIAAPKRRGLKIIDAFSRIVRLGEGVAGAGVLSPAAMDRTIDALKVCAEKMARRQVVGARCIATQACRSAANAPEFLSRVKAETGVQLELATPEEEARLSVIGCSDLIDPQAKAVMVFDIGGGSTELSWLKVSRGKRGVVHAKTLAWVSLPVGVVTLAERHGLPEVSADAFNAMADDVATTLAEVAVPGDIRDAFAGGEAHLIGTSGTVTSLAGVHLGLSRYSRDAVDGLWMTRGEIDQVTERLRTSSTPDRQGEPNIGRERADLVIPGSAILQGLLKAWPTERIRVGDRGLREGILLELIDAWRRETSADDLSNR